MKGVPWLDMVVSVMLFKIIGFMGSCGLSPIVVVVIVAGGKVTFICKLLQTTLNVEVTFVRQVFG